MKKAPGMISLSCCMLLVMSACSIPPGSRNAALDTLAAESELTITASKSQVSRFVAINTGFTTSYDPDECYNITPSFMADHSDYRIFKYGSSAASFLVYDGQAYPAGECIGGYGITSMALADLDRNGQYEAYFTFSWGSGLHRSQIGYFDPTGRVIRLFDYSYLNHDMILTVNEAGVLCVNSAVFDGGSLSSFVDFTIKARDLIGTIELEADGITLRINGQNTCTAGPLAPG